jgi:hypothetical protein
MQPCLMHEATTLFHTLQKLNDDARDKKPLWMTLKRKKGIYNEQNEIKGLTKAKSVIRSAKHRGRYYTAIHSPLHMPSVLHPAQLA